MGLYPEEAFNNCGAEVSGVITRVGRADSNFKEGDRVVAVLTQRFCTYPYILKLIYIYISCL